MKFYDSKQFATKVTFLVQNTPKKMASGGLPPTKQMPPPRGWTPGASLDPAQNNHDEIIANNQWHVSNFSNFTDQNSSFKTFKVLTQHACFSKMQSDRNWIFFVLKFFQRLMESCQNTNSIQFNDKCGQFISYWNFLGTDPVAKRLVDTPQQERRFCQLLRCSSLKN